MTMPDERLRAIGWGEELLQQIASDTALPKTLTAAAQRIALTYPPSQALEQAISSVAHGLQPAWTSALLDALELFDEIRIRAIGSAGTRSDLRYTLRHFPDKTTIRAMSYSSSIQEWLRLPRNR